ncbi:hypothetical protein JF66_00715 [Cryobacterium sp. MLB-32]|uniref:universal stress protein n=1 Tax=Cryobacterium sp. MLB-32 TaxID=1529318 RepID=UPI0004E73AD6|nr:universal stress protein [Cryobacterium sp. MLB-32]KFF61023.1 hypothetical protein JF66_00715 [Cryobacterium sp. MLB-32]
MSDTILVAVNDSPAAFDAVTVAIEQARRLDARLHAVMVIEEGSVERRLLGSQAVTLRRELAADAVLAHVALLATRAGVTVGTHRRSGRIAAEILAEARAVGAGLIVLARVDRPGHAIPSIGSHTLRVLEFSPVPVLVIPPD